MKKRIFVAQQRAIAWTTCALLAVASVGTLAGGNGFCGDGLIGPNETCDDGNRAPGDGCSTACLIENNYQCSGPFVPLGSDTVEDGDFERGAGNTPWEQQSSQNETVLCSEELCPQDFFARRGAWWARLGSSEVPGFSLLKQDVDIPATHRFLDFDLMLPTCDGNLDFLHVLIDGNIVLELRGDDPRCFDKVYEKQLLDLENANGGPYNDGGQHTLEIIAETFFETNNATLFLLDNVRIGRQTAALTPGRCELEELTLRYEDFDPGVQGDLGDLGLTTFELGDPVPWGTTDDGICGSGQVPPGNFTGGEGEAACLDATTAGGAQIQSFFCTEALDFTDAFASQLSFLLNVQLGQKGPNDSFTVFVGTVPPGPGTIDGPNYTQIFETTQSIGSFGQPPGQLISLSIDNLDDQPEGYICFGFNAETAAYAQVDNVDVSYNFCTEDNDEDKLQTCFDNCTERANPDQTDSDGDGYGNACDPDINRELAGRVPSGNGNDCIVNITDLGFFRVAFFSSPADSHWNPDADFNNDLVINVEDLGILKLFFFSMPGPSAATSACEMAP